jgi:DNA-binding beta-propeller fold protein YncE
MAITPDGNYAVATTNANPGTLEVINIASMTSVSLPVPALHWGSDMAGVAITADGNTAYVGQGSGGRVIVFDIHDRAHPVQTATEINACGSQAYFLALSPNQQDLFVACMAPSKVAVINLATNTVRANIPLQFDSHPNVYPGGIVVSPDGNYVYTQNIGQGQAPYPSISVIDTRLIDNSSPNATAPRIHTTVLSQGGEWSQPSLNHDGSQLASPSMYSLTDGTSAGVKIFETSDLIAGENASPSETVAIADGATHSSSVFSATYLPSCNSLLVSASVANANPAVVTLDRTGPACGSSGSQSAGSSGSSQNSGSSTLANTGANGSGLTFAAYAFLTLGALVVGGMLALRRTRQ